MKPRLWLVAGLVLALVLTLVPGVEAQQEEPVAKGYLFYSETCPTCHQVRAQVLPELYQRFQQQLQITAIEISSDDANYRWLLACADKYGVPEDKAKVPILFIGDTYLAGPDIEARLPELVEQYIEKGGVEYPDVPRPDGPLQSTVRFMFFYSPTCPHCEAVKTEILPQIKAKFGQRVQWEAYDTSDEKNYQALLILGNLAQLPSERRGAVPVIFIGNEFSLYTLLVGSAEIAAYLESAIEWHLDIGGTDLPGWTDQLFEMASTPLAESTPVGTPSSTPAPQTTPSPANGTPAPGTPTSEGPAIHMAYFAEAGCSECDAVANALNHLQNRFPTLVIHQFDIIDDVRLNLCLSEELGVPEGKRHDAPAVFVGEDYLVADNVQYEQLIELVSKYVETGAEPSWETCNQEMELPPPPPWWAVVLPGLGDGINPCAFATIVFLVSYLSLLERKGSEILLVGAAFTLAVFLSYLAFGMVLREILSGLIRWTGPVLRPILNGITALLCLLLAAFSLSDFRKARRGRSQDMALRLPDRLRKWINATIRQSMKARTFVGASFVAGVIVSFIELACTGQVYVPIILGLSNPGYRAQSVLSLIVYCLAFIIPLVIVFALSYMGTTSQQLGATLRQHTPTVKLVTAMLFLAIGFWLIYDVLRVWGVFSPLFVAASF